MDDEKYYREDLNVDDSNKRILVLQKNIDQLRQEIRSLQKDKDVKRAADAEAENMCLNTEIEQLRAESIRRGDRLVRCASKVVDLKQLLQSLLNKVNVVTAQWRHHTDFSTKAMDELCNRQIDVENGLRELEKPRPKP